MHKLRTLHLFAGSGGGLLADMLTGHQCVCAVEIDAYRQQVLHARQKDGILPWFPIFADVKKFDGKSWRGNVDIVAGGFPCQDISVAGRGAGITGTRSGLWKEFARVVSEVRPRYVFVENSPALTVRGLGVVLGDLAAMGYDARWGVLSAENAGAPHKRERIWIVAYTDKARSVGSRERVIPVSETDRVRSVVGVGVGGGGDGGQCAVARKHVADSEGKCILAGLREAGKEQDRNRPSDGGESMADSDSAWQSQCQEVSDTVKTRCDNERVHTGTTSERLGESSGQSDKGHSTGSGCDWWAVEPDVGRVVDGLANRMDRLASIGDGQVPRVAALAWNILGVSC